MMLFKEKKSITLATKQTNTNNSQYDSKQTKKNCFGSNSTNYEVIPTLFVNTSKTLYVLTV